MIGDQRHKKEECEGVQVDSTQSPHAEDPISEGQRWKLGVEIYTYIPEYGPSYERNIVIVSVQLSLLEGWLQKYQRKSPHSSDLYSCNKYPQPKTVLGASRIHATASQESDVICCGSPTQSNFWALYSADSRPKSGVIIRLWRSYVVSYRMQCIQNLFGEFTSGGE